MVDRYVFGLSTKHPVVSVKDLNSQAFQLSRTRAPLLFPFEFMVDAGARKVFNVSQSNNT